MPKFRVRLAYTVEVPQRNWRPELETLVYYGVGKDVTARDGELLIELVKDDDPKPVGIVEAADALARVVRDSQFGDTRSVLRKTTEAGFDDPHEWLESALDAYREARSKVKP